MLGNLTRWCVRAVFIGLFAATGLLWSCSYNYAFDFGHIDRSGSWVARAVGGRVDFIRMNYDWPRSIPGWHFDCFSASLDTDVDFLRGSSSYLVFYSGPGLGPGFGSDFYAVPLWVPTLSTLLVMSLAIRLTRREGGPSMLALIAQGARE